VPNQVASQVIFIVEGLGEQMPEADTQQERSGDLKGKGVKWMQE
jgi:hypothetical protein